MMGNLIKAELLRLVGSRLLLAVGLVGLLVGCWTGLEQASTARPLSPEEREIRAEEYRQDVVEYQRQVAEACGTPQELQSELCTELKQWVPELEHYGRVVTDFEEVAGWTLSSTGHVGLVVIVVLVAVLIGGEFSSGTISTQLTFTPRRRLVMWAKTLVAGLAGLAIIAWWVGVGFVMSIVGFVQSRSMGELVTSGDLPAAIARFVLLGPMAGVLTALLTIALGSALRAAAAIAVGYIASGIAEASVYLVAFDMSGSPMEPGYLAALPSVHLSSLINGGWNVTDLDALGNTKTYAEISYGQSLLYAFGWAVVLGVWATWAFSRRDMLR